MTVQDWTVDNIPDLTGKVAVVTGANSGIGYETALALAKNGAHVVVASRNEAKALEAMQQIRKGHPSASLEFIALDLADLQSVTDFARTFKASHQRLDILINNAGVMAIPYRETKDGFEMQFGTNHLGHFALTGHLIDVLMKTPESRVVTVSSSLHRSGKINFDDLNGKTSYSQRGAYSQSKLANLLFMRELHRRLAQAGADVISTAAHPGYAATNLQYVGPEMNDSKFTIFLTNLANRWIAQDAAAGALPTLYAATAPSVKGGEYFGPDGFIELKGAPVRVDMSEAAKDMTSAARLWDVSREMTGVTYDALEHIPA